MKAATLEAALIAHAPDAVLFVDCTGVIRLWNRGAETLFGYSAAEAIGHTPRSHSARAHAPRTLGGLLSCRAAGSLHKRHGVADEPGAHEGWQNHRCGIIGSHHMEHRRPCAGHHGHWARRHRAPCPRAGAAGAPGEFGATQVTALKSQSNHHPRIRARRGAGAGRRACDSAAGRLAGSDRRPSHRRSPELLFLS